MVTNRGQQGGLLAARIFLYRLSDSEDESFGVGKGLQHRKSGIALSGNGYDANRQGGIVNRETDGMAAGSGTFPDKFIACKYFCSAARQIDLNLVRAFLPYRSGNGTAGYDESARRIRHDRRRSMRHGEALAESGGERRPPVVLQGPERHAQNWRKNRLTDS